MSGNILDALQEKKALLEKLLGSIKKAAGLLKDDKVGEFEKELQNCEQIMRGVDELDCKVSAADRSPAVSEIEKDVERILAEIAQANKECQELSQEMLKGFGKQIKALRQKKQGMDAYNKTARSAVFIDAKK